MRIETNYSSTLSTQIYDFIPAVAILDPCGTESDMFHVTELKAMMMYEDGRRTVFQQDLLAMGTGFCLALRFWGALDE